MTLYRQIAEDVRKSILQGVYGVDEKLPSVRDVSKQREISINTVLRAYGLLEQDGWITAAARSGYYVCSQDTVGNQAEAVGAPWTGHFEDLMPKLLEHSRNTELLNLSVAQPEPDVVPELLICKKLRDVLRNRTADALGYCDPSGMLELRKQIALLYAGSGLAVDPNRVIVTNGCQEALYIAMRTVAKAGEIVAVQSPCYCGALQLLSSQGVKILEIPSTPDHGIRMDLLHTALKKYRISACYVTPTLGNPNGSTMPEDSKKELCYLARRQGFSIVEDFSNGDLCTAEEGRRPLKTYDRGNNVILCSSVSKTLSPGLRTGWLVPGKKLAESKELKYETSLNASTMNQLTVSGLLAAGDYRRQVIKAQSIHANSLGKLRQAILCGFPVGTTVSDPAGGHCLWVELPQGYDAGEICRSCFDEGIVLAPGNIFSVDRNYDNCMRIGWGGRWSKKVASAIQTAANIAKSSRC